MKKTQRTYRSWSRGRAYRLQPDNYRGQGPIHVVVGTAGRHPFFSELPIAQVVFDAMASNEESLAICLMPDHLHWLLRSGEGLSAKIGRYKSYTTKLVWEAGHMGRLWQGTFYDRILRSAEDPRLVAEYIWWNPVRAGLVEAPERYRFSKVWWDRFPM